MKSVRLLVCSLVACSHSAAPAREPVPAVTAPAPAAPAAPVAKAVTISVIGTNDAHGSLQRLPIFAGFIANLRAARAADGGGVVLLDGGDMFQGTLESNLGEGADMVAAYNVLGYTAVAVGNHEFDYGPEGTASTAIGPKDDPRGALKARAREAKFPLLVANIADAATGERIDYPNMPASVLVEVAGVKVGILGLSTESTPYTTMPANFVGLKMVPPAPILIEQARALRARGARVVLATMHIGSACKDLDHHDDVSSCEQDSELFKLLAEVPPGTVDVIVAGHTHAGVAHRINGTAVIESFASARAFGRVDLRVEPDGKVSDVRIERPHRICSADKDASTVAVAECAPGEYEGRPVVADAEIQKIADAALERARERRHEKIGVVLAGAVTRAHGTESAEGNLVTDLMLAARGDAQVAVTNGGGLRNDLPAGELTYGQLFEAMPFDNRFAIIAVTGKDLRTLVTANLARGGGILSWSGLTAKARCKAGKLDVAIKVAGKPLVETARYKLAASDFLASGGDGMIGKLNLPASAIKFTDVIIRDAAADVLRSWKSTPRATIEPTQLYAAARPRLDYEGTRPLTCGGAPGKESDP